MLNNQVVNPYEFPTRTCSIPSCSITYHDQPIHFDRAGPCPRHLGRVGGEPDQKRPGSVGLFLRELDGVHPGDSTGIQLAELEVFAENFKDFKDHFDPFLDNSIKGENTIAAWSLECISYFEYHLMGIRASLFASSDCCFMFKGAEEQLIR